MRQLLWGNDVGSWQGIGRLALKTTVALGVAFLIHEGLANHLFFKKPEVAPLADQVNKAFCSRGIQVAIDLDWEQSPDKRYTALAYTLRKTECKATSNADAGNASPAPETTISSDDPDRPEEAETIKSLPRPPERKPDFYRLWHDGVSHPQVTDSLHVLMRRAEKTWKEETGKELLLCAESRRSLRHDVCAETEAARLDIEREDVAVSLGSHLKGIKLGSLILGPWQWLTLSAFIFALIEAVGLKWRWVDARSFVGQLVDHGIGERLTPEEVATFEKRLAEASDARVRSFIDRFLEKALSASNTPAEVRLRNFRDMQVDECVSKMDTLESIGDTMLKIAFMGTVFGIGTALFAARNLDAADPLLRLVAKSEMYAGIGMGFGATLVGILLSILAAKSRAWLMSAWLSAIDDAWRRATIFYDAYYGGRATPASVPGVSPVGRPYSGGKDDKRGAADKAVDAFMTTLGYVGLAAALSYAVYILWTR